MGLGMATAEAALPASWMISAVTAWFLSPSVFRMSMETDFGDLSMIG